MGIFADIDPARHGFTVADSVTAILLRRNQLGLDTPWSIAELRLDAEDYAWLQSWGQAVSAGILHRWLTDSWEDARLKEGFEARRDAALGLMLMTLATEVCRRESTEGAIWQAIRGSFAPEARERLFVSSTGIPTANFKEALVSAAVHFELRHLFDEPGMAWYGTVRLQFGFTRRGFERRLPEWLALSRYADLIPDSIAALQAPEGPHHSESFQRLWRDLERLEAGMVTESGLRQTILDSCWVLPEWSDSLCARAKAPRPNRARGDGDSDSFSWLSASRLIWLPGETPRLRASIENLGLLELTGSDYRLEIDGDLRARVLSDGEGRWDADPASIDLPWRPAVRAHLLPEDPSPSEEEEIHELIHWSWEPQADVHGWDLQSHRPLDLEGGRRPAATHQVGLLVHESLDVLPVGFESHAVGKEWRLLRIPAGQLGQVCVSCDGFALWEGVRPEAEPVWAKDLSVVQEPSPGVLEEWVNLRFVFPSGVKFRRVHLSGDPEEVRVEGDLLSVHLTPERVASASRLTIWATAEGKTHRIVRPFSTLWIGALRITGSGMWEGLDPRSPLESRNRSQERWKFGVPALENSSEGRGSSASSWSLFEGTWPVFEQVPTHLTRLPELSGLGAALELISDARDSKPVTVASEVRHRGCIQDVIYGPDIQSLSVQLTGDIRTDLDYCLVVWDEAGEVKSRDIRLSGSVLDFPSTTAPVMVSIALEGDWLGSWWSPKPTAAWWEVAAQDPIQAAFLLKWGRGPVLAPGYLAPLRSLVSLSLPMILPWWVIPGRRLAVAGHRLRSNEVRDGWRAVVRKLVLGWTPDCLLPPDDEWDLDIFRLAQVTDLIRALGDDPLSRPGPDAEPDPVSGTDAGQVFRLAMGQLRQVEPRLLHTIVRFLTAHPFESEDPLTDARRFLQTYQTTILEERGSETLARARGIKRGVRDMGTGRSDPAELELLTTSLYVGFLQDQYLRRLNSDPALFRRLCQAVFVDAIRSTLRHGRHTT